MTLRPSYRMRSMAESSINQQSARWQKSTNACHSSRLNTAPVGMAGLINKAALIGRGSIFASASISNRQPCCEGIKGIKRGTPPARRTRLIKPTYIGSVIKTSSPGSRVANSTFKMPDSPPALIRHSVFQSYFWPDCLPTKLAAACRKHPGRRRADSC